jgi:ABC-2 type transport system permease protein
VDVRPDAMDKTSPIVGKLAAITLNWASPVTVDGEKNKGRQVSVLLKSTVNSWLRASPDILPDTSKANLGFASEGEQVARPLAVAVSGSFESAFKGKPVPSATAQPAAAGQQAPVATPAPQAGSVIEASPDTARLVVIGSSDFLSDLVFQLSSSTQGDRYLNSLQFLQNAVDWSVEDLDLLAIRSRGVSSRVLKPMAAGDETIWEVLNYGIALAALVAIGVIWLTVRRREKPMTLEERG